jgi:hypothetical protein
MLNKEKKEQAGTTHVKERDCKGLQTRATDPKETKMYEGKSRETQQADIPLPNQQRNRRSPISIDLGMFITCS